MKKRHYTYNDSLSLFSHPVAFQPAVEDSDELIQSIVADQTNQDDKWELTEAPDGERLAQFWDQVAREWDSDSVE